MNYDDRPWVESYDHWVEPDLPIPDVPYGQLLDESIRQFPDRPAFHFMGVTRTYAGLDRDARRFANFLVEVGCTPGEVVGINLPNTPQYIVALAGAVRAGCVASGVSPLLSPKEMACQLEDCGARVLVTLDALFEHKLLKIQDRAPRLSHIVATNIADYLPRTKRLLGKALKKIPSGKVGAVPGKTVISFMDVLRRHPPTCPQASTKPGDTFLIQYTGGTTGLPKGAELSHRNLVANTCNAVNWFDARRGSEVYCSGFPFFHMAGLCLCLAVLAMGNTQILIPDPRNTAHICKEFARYRPAFLFNVPSLYQMLLDEPRFKRLDFSQCRFCGSAASPLTAESFRALERIVGPGKVLELYGMTETGPLLTANPHQGQKKIASIGLALQNTRIKIVDLETGTQEVPIGEKGEIIAQGPQVMKRYHNRPEETAHALREFQGQRWMFTGDVATMDQDGYIFIVDRAKDMINVGGFKVFSKETEETLYEHPAVECCAIIGVPNPKRPGSQLVKAVIQPKSSFREQDAKQLEQEIVDYCRETMAPYKVPKIVQFIDQMPMTAVGKVDKKALR